MDTVYILVIENNNPNTHLKLKGFFSKDMIDEYEHVFYSGPIDAFFDCSIALAE